MTAAELANIIQLWLDDSCASEWGDFERDLDELLERNGYAEAE